MKKNNSIYQVVLARDLLERNYFYYSRQLAIIVLLIAINAWSLFTFNSNYPALILNALFLSFISVQMGIIGHEAAHYQILKSTRRNYKIAVSAWNLGVGLSAKWWQDQHNKHHAHPNDIEQDPSTNVELFSFSEEQFEKRAEWQKWFVRKQAYFYFPFMAFSAFYLMISNIIYLLKVKPSGYAAELFFIGLHYVVYITAIFVLCGLGFWQGVIFMLLHRAFSGLYMGSIFAPNHKGMPLISSKDNIDPIIQQVITSRNIRGNPIVDFIYGGLNYQIEHHLFPSMPRNNLKKARPLVISYCQKNNIPYYETGIYRSFREIISCLNKEAQASKNPA